MNAGRDRHWWYPVAAVDALGGEPLPVQLMDEPLVLWRGAGGTPAALVDRCPHRGARLSLGRICGGEIECPYHGWRFEPAGRCVAIPALPSFEPPATHGATPWRVRPAHGMLWAAAPGAADTAPFAPSVLDGLPARQLVFGPYEVATSAPRLVENFLDTAHFGFVHEGFLGERDHAAVPAYEVVHDTHGRPGVPAYRAWQPRASSAADAGAWVDYRYQVLGPTSALLTKQATGDAPLEAYALWACPLTHESSRVWFTLFTSDATRSDDTLRTFQDTIFAQDRPVLESQRPHRLPHPQHEKHCAADRLSMSYRRWLFDAGITWGVGPAPAAP